MSDTFLDFLRTEIGERGPFEIRSNTQIVYRPGSDTRRLPGEIFQVSAPYLAGLIREHPGAFDLIDQKLNARLKAAMERGG